MRRRGIVVLLVILVSAPGLALGDEPEIGTHLKLMNRLPRDPLAVSVSRVGNGAELYDQVLSWMDRFLPEDARAEMDQGVAKINQKLGLDLRTDLLSHLGPEVAFVADMPAIDLAAGLFMAKAPGAITQTFGGFGFLVEVDDRVAVDKALRTVFTALDFTVTSGDGVVKLDLPAAAKTEGMPEIAIYYVIDDGVLAIGLDAAKVKSAVRPRAKDQRLTAGADFRAVAQYLDRDVTSLAYFNLPRIQQMLQGSEVFKGALASQPEAKPMLDLILDSHLVTTGFASTTTSVGGGCRRVAYGPSWMGGGSTSIATVGIISAIAIPNLINAVERARGKRTMADLRTLGTAVGAFAVDNNVYPGPTDGWVDVSTIETDLSPVYIKTLPTMDGWSHPILYWSDGQTFTLVSPGKDGEVSRDWSGAIEGEPEQTTDPTADIVFRDGFFVSSPAAAQN